MNKYYKYPDKNYRISLADNVGRGGEGEVWTILDHYDQVAKIYYPSHRTIQKKNKLEIMINNPPIDHTRSFVPPHISLAWPTDILYQDGEFAGYIMPYIDRSPSLFKISNPRLRREFYSTFDYRYLHRTAQNIAIAVDSMHKKNYIIGDINQNNILVTDRALITFIDTDSIQVYGKENDIYRCTVGVAEYTPPELHGLNLDEIDRTEYHDNFGLGIIIFQLLMEGYHPFTGAQKDIDSSISGEIYLHCLKNGIFPYSLNEYFDPPPNAPDFCAVNPALRELFIRCFINGYNEPSSRPFPNEWIKALKEAEFSLLKCDNNDLHWYYNFISNCPWCEREKLISVPEDDSEDINIIIKESKKLPGTRSIVYINNIELPVRYIPAGSFIMGSPESEKERNEDEIQHTVVITRGFNIMETQVTQKLYEAITGKNPSGYKNAEHPVENIDWFEAIEFCNILSRLTGRKWELPSEAEWEYACRAMSSGPFHYGDSLDSFMANFNGKYPYNARIGPYRLRTVPVGCFHSNDWGLLDMHGNVWEWCYDSYFIYSKERTVDPKFYSESIERVLRGGSWFDTGSDLRSASRNKYRPGYKYKDIGFRAVMR